MVIAKQLMEDVLEALESAVLHAEAKRVPMTLTLAEMKRILWVAQLKIGRKA